MNLSKIRKYNGSSYSYLIPKWMVINEYNSGKVVVSKDSDNWVAQRCIGRILNYCCSLSIQEYYDKMVLEISSNNDRPRCSYCGKYLQFSGKISHGYGHHSGGDQSRLFCNSSHLVNYLYSHPEEYSDWNNKCGFKNTLQLTHRNQFINSGSPDDTCYFYVAKRLDGSIKFGITSDVLSRIRRSKNTKVHNREIPYIKLVVIGSSDRISIANLEYNYKVSYNKMSETINSFTELIQLVHYVKSSLTN